MTTQDSKGHPTLLPTGQALYLLECHVTSHTKLPQHPPILLHLGNTWFRLVKIIIFDHLLPRKLSLHYFYRTDRHIKLVHEMLNSDYCKSFPLAKLTELTWVK